MSFFKNQVPILLLLSVFFSFDVHYLSSEDGKEICVGRNPNYFLSLGLRSQSKAKQLVFSSSQKEVLGLYQESLRNFENYFTCRQGLEIPSEVHLHAATAYMELGDYKRAGEEVRIALLKDGTNRESIVLNVKLMIRQGKLDEAENFLENNISKSPEDSDLLFLLGSLNKETGRYNKAILYFTSLYDSIVKRNGNPKYKIHVLKNLADIYYQKGDGKKALINYQGYLVLNPKDTNVKIQLAHIFNILGDYGASKKILQNILKENSGDNNVELLLAEMNFVESRKTSYPFIKKLVEEGKVPKTHLVYALYSVLSGQYSYADEFLRSFLPKNENRIAARLAWLEVLRKNYSENDLQKELKTMSELTYSIRQFSLAYNLSKELLAIQMKSKNFQEDVAYTNWFLSNCMEQQESPHRAILYAKESIRVSQNTKEKEKYKLHLGHLLLKDKIMKYKEANSIANDILISNHKNPEAHFLNAYSLFLMKKYEDSLVSIDKAINLDTDNSGYYFFKGIISEKLNNIPDIEWNMEKSIELNPNNPAPYNYLGYLYADRNMNLDKSYKLVRKAVELEPDNGAYQDSLGWVYFRKNDIDNALFHLYLAKQLLEDREIKDFTVYDHLGDVYQTKGEGAIARDYWKKAKDLSESSEDKFRIKSKIDNR